MRLLRFVSLDSQALVIPTLAALGFDLNLSPISPRARETFPAGCRPLYPGEHPESTDWWFAQTTKKWELLATRHGVLSILLASRSSFAHVVKYTARPLVKP